MDNLIARSTFKCAWHLHFRSLVLRPDGDPAPAGEHLWVRAGCRKRGAELHELPDGSASLHHGDLRSTAAALWHPRYHFCIIHHHWAHYVLPVRTQSQEKTSPRHIRSRHGPHIHACDAYQHWLHSAPVKWMSPSCSFSNVIATIHAWLSHSFQHNTAGCLSHLGCFLPAGPCATAANKNSGEIEWETRSPFVYISWGGYNKCSNGTSRGNVLI